MGDYCEVCGERHATHGVLCDECWKVTPDGMLERAEKAEARIALLEADLTAANATIARMAPVVEAAVAWKAAHDEVRDDDAGKLWDALCAAVEKYEGE